MEQLSGRPPVILLHSSGLSSRQWRRLCSTLDGRYAVIAHDFLGCGSNSQWSSGQRFEVQMDVDRVRALLSTLDGRVHLVGHSYGGFVALALARLEGARVASLALYEPTAFGLLDRADADLDRLVQTVLLEESQIASPVGSEAWFRTFTAYWGGEGLWDVMPQETRTAFLHAGRKVYLEARALMLDRTPPEAYRDIAVPTLLMCGVQSPESTRLIATRLAHAMPCARLREFASAGHLGPITHATLVSEAIDDHPRLLRWTDMRADRRAVVTLNAAPKRTKADKEPRERG